MKKIFLPLILVLGVFISTVSAQEGAYLNVYGSYGLAGASATNFVADGVMDVDSFAHQMTGMHEWMDYNGVMTLDGDGNFVLNSTTTTSKVNLGSGLNFGATFGYMFNDHIGAELGFGYFLGGKNTFSQEFKDETDPANVVTTTATGEIYANQFRINPMLVISTDFKDFVPYAKFGVVLGVGTKVMESYSDNKMFSADNIVQNFESKGGLSVGITGVVGALYQLNKKTGIFLELATTSMSYAPKTRTLTDYTINGDDALSPYVSTAAKETEYSDEVSSSSAEEFDPTLSTLSTKIKYPFSTFGINLGLRFSF